MSAAIIAQLLIAIGPSALELIPKLAAVWTKTALTPEEVTGLCAPARASYDQYLAESKARLAAISPVPA